MNIKREKIIGLINGKLSKCPKSPNCVCSQYPEDVTHYMKAIPYNTSPEKALEKITTIVESHPRTEILNKTEIYMHVVFTMPVFKWKDDVQFFIDDSKKIIHFKSQSRIGYWDFGVNKKRMKWIKKKFKD